MNLWMRFGAWLMGVGAIGMFFSMPNDSPLGVLDVVSFGIATVGFLISAPAAVISLLSRDDDHGDGGNDDVIPDLPPTFSGSLNPSDYTLGTPQVPARR